MDFWTRVRRFHRKASWVTSSRWEASERKLDYDRWHPILLPKSSHQGTHCLLSWEKFAFAGVAFPRIQLIWKFPSISQRILSSQRWTASVFEWQCYKLFRCKARTTTAIFERTAHGIDTFDLGSTGSSSLCVLRTSVYGRLLLSWLNFTSTESSVISP